MTTTTDPAPGPFTTPVEGFAPVRRLTPAEWARERDASAALLWERVGDEEARARDKHGVVQWTRHQLLGILLEEVFEAAQVIFTDGPNDALAAELLQVIVVCRWYLIAGDRDRAPVDLSLPTPPAPPRDHLLAQLAAALQWCGSLEAVRPGGRDRAGWLTRCEPLLRQLDALNPARKED